MDFSRGTPPGGADPAGFYELHQEWPREIGRAVAEHLLSALGPPPWRCLFLGGTTGVNDVLPCARLADLRDRFVGSDVEPAYLDRLAEHARREGLQNVEVRRLPRDRGRDRVKIAATGPLSITIFPLTRCRSNTSQGDRTKLQVDCGTPSG